MARIVKDYGVRRDELLESARRLVTTKGYEQMTIQDILDDLQIAKGTFYHYFGSKQALLEALIERMVDEGEQLFAAIVEDQHLSGLGKLQRTFDTIGRWKTAQKTFHLALLRVWYADDNAIVRWKLHGVRIKRLRPLLTTIIRQGISEGVLATSYPDQLSDVVLSLLQEFVDALARLFLSYEPGRDDLPDMVSTVAVYTDALERVLGAPAGSLSLVDAATLKDWADSFVHGNVLSAASETDRLKR